jgi:hypothetical protein
MDIARATLCGGAFDYIQKPFMDLTRLTCPPTSPTIPPWTAATSC